MTIGYGLWSRSLGRPLFIVMILVMIPLAITELGTDSWITDITPAMTDLGLNAGWVLVYAMAIVLVLRLFAGPLVHRFSSMGLLAISAVIAALGLWLLSMPEAVAIVVAATVYSFGKAFFWPTSLGVVSEQSPKGGPITMNVVAGIGMLAAGIIGGPLIGQVLDRQMVHGLATYDAQHDTQLVATLKTDRTGILGDYTAIDPSKRAAIVRRREGRRRCGRQRIEARCAAHHRVAAGQHVHRVSRPDPVFPQQGRLQARGPRPEEIMGTLPVF